ncbi:MAG: MATE family efflux transporter [Lachnospira sp.]|nr:MATE family efflux transporter [Lachnospira sp.]
MKIQLSDHFSYSKLIKFTLPTIAMMIFTSIYGVVDGVFVSNCVGSDAFAAVNLIMPIIMILGSVGFMIGTGGSAIVSKTLGEGKKEKANEYFSMLVYLCVVSGVILSVIGIIFTGPIAVLLGAKGSIAKDCVTYGRTVFFMLTGLFLQNAFQSFLVVAEKPKLGLFVTLLAGFTNMFLDFLFVYVLRFGVFGAALATGISQFVGSVIPIIYFAGGKNNVLKLTKCRFNKDIIIKTCINGSSEMVTNMSMSLVNILYNMQLMKYIGTNGVVAYGIIMYAGFIFVGTYMGYAVGSAPVISYHYGAGNKDELKNLFKRSLTIIIVSSVVMTLIAEIIAGYLAGIFVSYDNNLLELTTEAIRIYAVSYLISGINIFASSFFTALNNGVVSAVISFMRMFVFQIVMILLLPVVLGISGIWTAVIAAEVLSVVISVMFLVKNRKKYSY